MRSVKSYSFKNSYVSNFLFGFPLTNILLIRMLKKSVQQLSFLWETSSPFFLLNFSSHFWTNTSGFNVNWMLYPIDHEISSVQQDLTLIRNESALFLTQPKLTKSTLQCPGASAGLAAVGLFRGGFSLGCSDSCGLRGSFGNWKINASCMLEVYVV